MFEFLSSPFGLVAVGLGVLAVAVLALCLWITTLDRRMRGMADGLEAERRKDCRCSKLPSPSPSSSPKCTYWPVACWGQRRGPDP